MSPSYCRVVALLAIGLWIAALFLPVFTADWYGAPSTEIGLGYVLLKYGWIGPFAGNIAWLANFFLAICVMQMVSGARPGRRIRWIGLVIALDAFLPFFLFDIEGVHSGGFHSGIVFGPAVWVWLMAFALVAVIPPVTSQPRMRVRALGGKSR